MLKGWISIPHDASHQEEKIHLESIGVKVGDFIMNKGWFIDCELEEMVITELQKDYGYYEWDLQ